MSNDETLQTQVFEVSQTLDLSMWDKILAAYEIGNCLYLCLVTKPGLEKTSIKLSMSRIYYIVGSYLLFKGGYKLTQRTHLYFMKNSAPYSVTFKPYELKTTGFVTYRDESY